jgi:hypothetical protein
MDTWSILLSLWTFGIGRGNLVYFLPVLVFCTNKNLATLAQSRNLKERYQLKIMSSANMNGMRPDFSRPQG